ncbi:hypothetical protein WJX72_008383 [[Myrmecia] bisecta]|uniref:Uncharacterized protein n=1 Tax=[Myrmecia] bisecta TaxID=41462 RepID=A0AAW1PKL4_9CHLO
MACHRTAIILSVSAVILGYTGAQPGFTLVQGLLGAAPLSSGTSSTGPVDLQLNVPVQGPTTARFKQSGLLVKVPVGLSAALTEGGIFQFNTSVAAQLLQAPQLLADIPSLIGKVGTVTYLVTECLNPGQVQAAANQTLQNISLPSIGLVAQPDGPIQTTNISADTTALLASYAGSLLSLPLFGAVAIVMNSSSDASVLIGSVSRDQAMAKSNLQQTLDNLVLETPRITYGGQDTTWAQGLPGHTLNRDTSACFTCVQSSGTYSFNVDGTYTFNGGVSDLGNVDTSGNLIQHSMSAPMSWVVHGPCLTTVNSNGQLSTDTLFAAGDLAANAAVYWGRNQYYIQ